MQNAKGWKNERMNYFARNSFQKVCCWFVMKQDQIILAIIWSLLIYDGFLNFLNNKNLYFHSNDCKRLVWLLYCWLSKQTIILNASIYGKLIFLYWIFVVCLLLTFQHRFYMKKHSHSWSLYDFCGVLIRRVNDDNKSKNMKSRVEYKSQFIGFNIKTLTNRQVSTWPMFSIVFDFYFDILSDIKFVHENITAFFT